MPKITPIHLAEIKNNELHYFYPELLNKWLVQLNEQKVEVIIRKRKNTRSNQQNKYLWGVVYQLISNETGMDVEEVHNFFKIKYLKKYVGKFLTVGSTTKLSTTEFNNYIDSICSFASQELNIEMPLPNTINY